MCRSLRYGLEPALEALPSARERRQVQHAADRGEDGEDAERAGHDPRGLAQLGTLLVAAAVRPVEGVEHQPGHVERGAERAREAQGPEDVPGGVRGAAGEGRAQDLIFREEPRERRHPRDRESGDPHERAGPGQVRLEAAHVSHVLRVLV